MKSWYALAVKTNHERAIQESPYAGGVEFFDPRYSEDTFRRGRRVSVARPLFPGYLFARFESLRHAAALRSIAGVFDIVSFDGRPAAIPDEQIESIRKLLASDRAVSPCPFLSIAKGDVVDVKYGPLAGTRGKVIALKGKAHVLFIVSIDMLGRSVCATVPREQLRKAA